MAPRSKIEAKKSSQVSDDADGNGGKEQFSAPFNEPAIRRAFVSKVFTIFATMLSVTFGILIFFMFV